MQEPVHVTVYFPDHKSTAGVNLFDFPTLCPICQQHGLLEWVGNATLCKGTRGREVVQVPVRCPNHKCGGVSIVEFTAYFDGPRLTHACLYRQVPSYMTRPTIEPEIQTLSPTFGEVYTQAMYADQLGFDQIHGMALRKALEFLVKDFCISKHPNDAAKIKKMPLADVIATYIDDVKIKACAKRATWLGNDETHFVRKWTTHDATDLRKLLELTVHWMAHTIKTDHYLSTMPQP